MICHRTIGPRPAWNTMSDAGRREGIAFTEPEPCLGSSCALWVPEVDERGDLVYSTGGHSGTPTGRGWCADNLRREPIQDPAKGNTP